MRAALPRIRRGPRRRQRCLFPHGDPRPGGQGPRAGGRQRPRPTPRGKARSSRTTSCRAPGRTGRSTGSTCTSSRRRPAAGGRAQVHGRQDRRDLVGDGSDGGRHRDLGGRRADPGERGGDADPGACHVRPLRGARPRSRPGGREVLDAAEVQSRPRPCAQPERGGLRLGRPAAAPSARAYRSGWRRRGNGGGRGQLLPDRDRAPVRPLPSGAGRGSARGAILPGPQGGLAAGPGCSWA